MGTRGAASRPEPGRPDVPGGARAVLRTTLTPTADAVRTLLPAVPGPVSGVVPDALRFGWDVVTHGTPLEGSRLDVERVPVEVSCAACGTFLVFADYMRTPIRLASLMKIPTTFVIDQNGLVRWVGRDTGAMEQAVDRLLALHR